MGDIRAQARQVQHGFGPLVELAPTLDLATADELWSSPEHQSRMLAVIVWGLHPGDEMLARLRDVVSQDADWRVQEMLARSFTQWCIATGWEAALPTITDWLADVRPHVRRAATEGPRVWTSRDYFKRHPEEAVRILRGQLDDPDDYARRSAENALRDVLKRYPQLA